MKTKNGNDVKRRGGARGKAKRGGPDDELYARWLLELVQIREQIRVLDRTLGRHVKGLSRGTSSVDSTKRFMEHTTEGEKLSEKVHQFADRCMDIGDSDPTEEIARSLANEAEEIRAELSRPVMLFAALKASCVTAMDDIHLSTQLIEFARGKDPYKRWLGSV